MNRTSISPDGWFVYMVRCADNSLYTGVTVDLNRRIEEHNCSHSRAAKYTRTRRPVQLVYQEACNSRSEAARREWQLKSLSRADKLRLIESAGPGDASA